MELFEQLRREYEFGVGTVSGVASKFGVHRRQVRQALPSCVPPPPAVLVRPRPSLDPVKASIEAILVADKIAPRKQRHTAHRIWVRLCQEVPEHILVFGANPKSIPGLKEKLQQMDHLLSQGRLALAQKLYPS